MKSCETPHVYKTLDCACEDLKARVICQGSYIAYGVKIHVVQLQSIEDPSKSYYCSRAGGSHKWIMGVSIKGKAALCKKW